jgi:hypothetical protein
MDYFQGVVTEFLRANRSTFVNTEYLIQLDEGKLPVKSRHWYCDALAVNFEESTVFLCEVTYSKTMSAPSNRTPETPHHLRMASPFCAQMPLRSVAVYGDVTRQCHKLNIENIGKDSHGEIHAALRKVQERLRVSTNCVQLLQNPNFADS